MPGPLKPVVGTVELQAFMSVSGRLCSIRSFWSDFDEHEYTTGDLTALGTAFQGAFVSGFLPAMSNEVTYAGQTMTDLTSDVAPRVEQTASVAGSDGAAALPLNCAAVMKFLIPRRYRGGKPHVFIPGFPSHYLTDENHWGSSFITGMETNWSNVYAACNALSTSHSAHWTQVSVSRFSGHVERDIPVVDELFVPGWVLQPRVCSRRRRLPKLV